MNPDKRAKRAKVKAKATQIARDREKQSGFTVVTTNLRGEEITTRNAKLADFDSAGYKPHLAFVHRPNPPKYNADGTRVDQSVIDKLIQYGLWEQMQQQSLPDKNSTLIADDGCVFNWITNEDGYSGYSWFHTPNASSIYIATGE